MPTATPFNNLITFSRGSNATVTGPNGLIQWAPNNLVTNSESFDASAWVKTNATIFPNQDVGNGTFGPELVTNGAFTTDLSGWTLAGTPNPSWSAGGASMSGTSDLRQTLTTVAGTWYLLTFSVTGTFSSSFLNIGTTNGGNDLLNVFIPANGSILFRATTTTSFLRFLAASQTFTLDSISVKQVTFAAATAPDGTQTADNMVGSTGNNAKFVSQSSLPSTIGTFTVYAKAAGETVISLWLVGASVGASFTLTGDGSTSLLGATSSSITPVGNGWYRCAVYHNTATTTAHIYLRTGSSFIGDGTSGVLLWGAQLELGSTATTYNPTTVKNLLGFSEAFDNAAYTKVGCSIVTGAQANPINGLFNAQKLMADTSTGLHRMSGATALTISGGVRYTFSVYAKAAGTRYLFVNYTAQLNAASTFDLQTGTISATGSGTASITDVGNGWYRCSVTGTAPATALATFYLQLNDTGVASDRSYTGDGNSGVYIYGAQLSDSASLDPYVPTPGAAPSSTAFYGPRFDFDPVTRAPRGLLVEEQRTNVLLQSENFTVGPWEASVGGTSTRVNDGSPLGFTRALITATSANGGIRQTISSLTSGQVYALSFYIQSASTSVLLLFENGTGTFGSAHSVTINPSNGTAGVLIGFTNVSIQPFGPGYVYTLITAPAGGALTVNLEWRLSTSGESIRLGRPQFEAGAFATSYIPTVASTVTRSADIATITGQNFAQWYRQDEGCIVLEGSTFKPTTVSAGSFFYVNASDGTTSEQANIRLASTNVGGLVWDGGVLQAGMDTAYAANAIEKYALALKANDFAFARNGATPATDSSGSMPTVNRLSIGVNAAGSSEQLNGHIRNIRFIPARAADFQLQALST